MRTKTTIFYIKGCIAIFPLLGTIETIEFVNETMGSANSITTFTLPDIYNANQFRVTFRVPDVSWPLRSMLNGSVRQ